MFKSKRKRVVIITAAVILIAAAILCGIFLPPAIERRRTAAKSEHFTVTAAMYRYFTRDSFYNQLENYGQIYRDYYGIDEKTDLAAVMYDETTTWAAFFDAQNRVRLQSILAFAESAVDENTAQIDTNAADISSKIADLTAKARANGIKPAAYLEERYGKGVRESDIRSMESILALATARKEEITAAITVTDAEVQAYVAENERDLLRTDLLFYIFEAPVKPHGFDPATAAAYENAKAENLRLANELAAMTSPEGFTEWVRERETALAEAKGEPLTSGAWEEIRRDITYLDLEWDRAKEFDAGDGMLTRTAGECYLTPDENTGSVGVVYVIAPPRLPDASTETAETALRAAKFKEAETAVTAAYAPGVTVIEDTLAVVRGVF